MAKSDRAAAFELLGVSPDSDAKTVRAAWRAMVRSYHPDLAKDDPVAANRRLAEINAAFDVVSKVEEEAAAKPKPKPKAKSTAQPAPQKGSARSATQTNARTTARRASAARRTSAQPQTAELRDAHVPAPIRPTSAPNVTLARPTTEWSHAQRAFEAARKVLTPGPSQTRHTAIW